VQKGENKLRRRAFLGSMAAGSLLSGCSGLQREDEGSTEKPPPILDIHIHLFGTGDSGSGCFLSREIRRGLLFKALITILGVRRRGPTIDEGYAAMLVDHLRASGLDRGVVLAQDAVYDSSGKRDDRRTHFYVPNDYLFQVTERHPDLMVPCVSINPDRFDCLAELERCAARGARILKIHPPTQGVDISDPKHTRFFSRCAKLGMKVMVHTGHEHSAHVIDAGLADPRKLELALDLGCTVIACHSGTGWKSDRPDFLPAFLDLARKRKNLWGDTAVLGTSKRVRDFTRLLDEEDVRARLVHGSDFPFPAIPLAFSEEIGLGRALGLQLDLNFLRQDLRLKEALGIGRASAERAHQLLFPPRTASPSTAGPGRAGGSTPS
jgi:uncharacterized protein